ncbi:MAG: hypothetical protein KGI38_10510 [Thaumarchaeota archaeon]|nr:hypothetical protein [Nitrososphaerota archaeon]
MMTAEGSDLYEVTCLDCNTTKSYFTAQGVSYFRMSHEGHQIRAKEPAAPQESREPEAVVQTLEKPVEPVDEIVEPEAGDVMEEAPVMAVVDDSSVRLGNLVVDVVDEGKGRLVKVYGIAGGYERFSKTFEMRQVDAVNQFLESGLFFDDSNGTRYTWSPDKIDLSQDVVRMLDEPQAPVVEEQVETPVVITPEVEVPQPEVETPASPVPAAPEVVRPSPRAGPGPSDEVLLGKLSYVQEGEEYRLESVRVSRTLRKFRWSIEPPYVIGAMFDNLMSVQSQTGMIKSPVIEAVSKLGYTFIAVESPGGSVTAWFRKDSNTSEQSEGEVARSTEAYP